MKISSDRARTTTSADFRDFRKKPVTNVSTLRVKNYVWTTTSNNGSGEPLLLILSNERRTSNDLYLIVASYGRLSPRKRVYLRLSSDARPHGITRDHTDQMFRHVPRTIVWYCFVRVFCGIPGMVPRLVTLIWDGRVEVALWNVNVTWPRVDGVFRNRSGPPRLVKCRFEEERDERPRSPVAAGTNHFDRTVHVVSTDSRLLTGTIYRIVPFGINVRSYIAFDDGRATFTRIGRALIIVRAVTYGKRENNVQLPVRCMNIKINRNMPHTSARVCCESSAYL